MSALTIAQEANPQPTACETMQDKDVMFPDNEDTFLPGGRRNLALAQAKMTCGGCWFRLQCAEEAIDRREQHGIWGGLTLREREALRRRRYVKDGAAPVVAQSEALFDVELVG